MLALLWLITYANIFGIKLSSILSSIGALIGALLPCVLLIFIGIYSYRDYSMRINTHYSAWQTNHYSYFAGLILSFAGLESGALIASGKNDLKKAYPRAIFFAIFLMIALSLLGALSIALIIPANKIQLLSGVMQVFQIFFHETHFSFLISIMSILVMIGCLSSVNTRTIAPINSLWVAITQNHFSKKLQICNQRGVPIALLLLQAMISTIIMSVYFWMPTVSDSYWLLTVLTSQLTLLMNFLIFFSLIWLYFKKRTIKKLFLMPFGKWGLIFVVGIGMITCIFAFFIGFIPPAQLGFLKKDSYDAFLLCGLLLLIFPVFLLYFLRSKCN